MPPKAHLRRKLTVFGAYGGVNMGDEMILLALVDLARQAGYRGEINVILGTQPNDRARDDYEAQALNPVSYRNPLALTRAVVGRDLVIGGGQIIDGVANMQLPLLQLYLALVSRMTGGVVSIVGASTARLTSLRVRAVYRRLFERCSVILMRDKASCQDVLDIAPRSEDRLALCADLVFSLNTRLKEDRPLHTRPWILFAPHHAPALALTPADRARDLLARLLTEAPVGVQIGVIAHDSRSDFDLSFCQDLVASFSEHRRPQLLVPANTGEVIRLYQSARSVISVRMHPIILGACTGAACIPLARTRKLFDLSSRLGVEPYDFDSLLSLGTDAFQAVTGLAGNGKPPPAPCLKALFDQVCFGSTLWQSRTLNNSNAA